MLSVLKINQYKLTHSLKGVLYETILSHKDTSFVQDNPEMHSASYDIHSMNKTGGWRKMSRNKYLRRAKFTVADARHFQAPHCQSSI